MGLVKMHKAGDYWTFSFWPYGYETKEECREVADEATRRVRSVLACPDGDCQECNPCGGVPHLCFHPLPSEWTEWARKQECQHPHMDGKRLLDGTTRLQCTTCGVQVVRPGGA